ncbi:MAG: hypothetical protein KGL52_16835 [Rhodospirillales bacterium]|nr:hypothetical protein [Rhodospirillales bacterium]
MTCLARLLVRRAAHPPVVSKLLRTALAGMPGRLRRRVAARPYGPITAPRGHVYLPAPGQLAFLQALTVARVARAFGYAPRFGFRAGMQATARFPADRYPADRHSADQDAGRGFG